MGVPLTRADRVGNYPRHQTVLGHRAVVAHLTQYYWAGLGG